MQCHTAPPALEGQLVHVGTTGQGMRDRAAGQVAYGVPKPAPASNLPPCRLRVDVNFALVSLTANG